MAEERAQVLAAEGPPALPHGAAVALAHHGEAPGNNEGQQARAGDVAPRAEEPALPIEGQLAALALAPPESDSESESTASLAIQNVDIAGLITELLPDDDLLAWARVCSATHQAQRAGSRALRDLPRTREQLTCKNCPRPPAGAGPHASRSVGCMGCGFCFCEVDHTAPPRPDDTARAPPVVPGRTRWGRPDQVLVTSCGTRLQRCERADCEMRKCGPLNGMCGACMLPYGEGWEGGEESCMALKICRHCDMCWCVTCLRDRSGHGTDDCDYCQCGETAAYRCPDSDCGHCLPRECPRCEEWAGDESEESDESDVHYFDYLSYDSYDSEDYESDADGYFYRYDRY